MQNRPGWNQWMRPPAGPGPYAVSERPFVPSYAYQDWSSSAPPGGVDDSSTPWAGPSRIQSPGSHSFSHLPWNSAAVRPEYHSSPSAHFDHSSSYHSSPSFGERQSYGYPPPLYLQDDSSHAPAEFPYPHVGDSYYPTNPSSGVRYPTVENPYALPPESFSSGVPYGSSSYPQGASFSQGSLSNVQESTSFHHSPSGSSNYWPSNFPQGLSSPDMGNSISGLEIVSESEPPKRSLKFVLLHGTLEARIHAAKCLPNMDMFSESLRQCLVALDPRKQTLQKIEDRITNYTRKKITSDPYACVVLMGATVARTRVISNDQDPVWEEHFTILVAHNVAEVELVVKDNDMLGAQFIGEVKIPAEKLLNNEIVGSWHDLLGKDGKPCRQGAQIRLSFKFRPAKTDRIYKYGVGAGPDYSGVPCTYFPLRKGGRITLYQDADLEDTLPKIHLDGGIVFENRRCWEEICAAILEAHHLVYIAGWSIYCKIKLVRKVNRPLPEPAFLTLGELLKYKSRELVRVVLLVWDDKTSHSIINNVGVMGTHDEETRRYFKHSSVQCVLAPRYADSKLSWFKQQVVGTLYTHHQKTVIVDTQGPGNLRRLTAFVGGLDLCDGRYDTPEHCLFRTLNTVHKDDYHNPTFPTKADCIGPREPWHDLHCKIEGPAVYDVLTNFEQRWRKAARWRDDALANLDKTSWIISPKNKTAHGVCQMDDCSIVSDEYDQETWHTQVFRSIDSGSVKGFPKDVLEAEKQNLVCGKNIAIDMSIHAAYVNAIRSAQHFIYIENQYFIGSSYAWPQYKNAGADHLIPIELALKIASKIQAKERFAVYVVIPMWPEGNPTSNAVQEILYFQSQTMEMMYTIISQALQEADLAAEFHPSDYLNFFCLGNREMMGVEEPTMACSPTENTPQTLSWKYRRFMIYVHSKGMIVDDEYIIIGSANINQRSMDGTRDTEIAIGAYQPYHLCASKYGNPRGQVYGFRMSLWAEHMGVLENCFVEPWSLNCVQQVKSIAKGYWKQYVAEEVTEMKGHLLSYPIKVEHSGKVLPLPGYEHFPDVGGKVLGSSTSLPDNLTT